MRNVTRSQKPASLRKSAARWRRELLAARKEAEATGEKVPDRYYSKYKQKDVREALEQMYKGLCCYCEASIGVVSFGNIEHRKLKQRYPKSCFDWDNLHLACEKCNNTKKKKYNKNASILDAVKDIPISKHLTYECQWRMPLTARGRITVEHADLNRDTLKNARVNILLPALRLIGKINTKPNDLAVCVTKDELASKRDGQFGSLIIWAMETYLRDGRGSCPMSSIGDVVNTSVDIS